MGQLYTVEMAYFSATLTATAVAGATVTATCGETVVTGQAAGNGQAALEIKLPGNYVVQALITISKGDTNISLTGTGSDQVYLPSTGTWAVTASKDDLDASA